MLLLSMPRQPRQNQTVHKPKRIKSETGLDKWNTALPASNKQRGERTGKNDPNKTENVFVVESGHDLDLVTEVTARFQRTSVPEKFDGNDGLL